LTPSSLPPPRKYQEQAAQFILDRFKVNKGAYLAAEQGLGKTRIATMVAQRLKCWVLYVSPPGLIENVGREFQQWWPGCATLIISDAMLIKGGTQRSLGAELKRARKLYSKTMIVVDEAHRFKDPHSQRSMALFQAFVPAFDHVLYMSGTPMPNGRPHEIWPVVNAHQVFRGMSEVSYGQTYCNGHFDHAKQAWDFTGVSNVDELFAELQRSFMLRITKKEVLVDLPPKIWQTIYLPADTPDIEADFVYCNGGRDKIVARYGEGQSPALSSVRREVGLAKVKHAVEFIKTTLVPEQESVIVFAYHVDVVKELATALANFAPAVITGDTPLEERQALVDAFQMGLTPIMIANYVAGGVGFNLTEASRIIFVEFSWSPGENAQAEDRAHRLGQKGNVLIQYLVFPGSLDDAMLAVNLKKQRTIDKL
jgi:SNF2 family DNA or RNA helicase